MNKHNNSLGGFQYTEAGRQEYLAHIERVAQSEARKNLPWPYKSMKQWSPPPPVNPPSRPGDLAAILTKLGPHPPVNVDPRAPISNPHRASAHVRLGRAVVTFDLQDAEREDYDLAYELLARRGLSRVSPHKEIDLPSTTVLGEWAYVDVPRLGYDIEKLFTDRGLKPSKILVGVMSGWGVWQKTW